MSLIATPIDKCSQVNPELICYHNYEGEEEYQDEYRGGVRREVEGQIDGG